MTNLAWKRPASPEISTTSSRRVTLRTGQEFNHLRSRFFSLPCQEGIQLCSHCHIDQWAGSSGIEVQPRPEEAKRNRTNLPLNNTVHAGWEQMVGPRENPPAARLIPRKRSLLDEHDLDTLLS